MKKYIAPIISSLAFFAPAVVSAQVVRDAESLSERIISLGNLFVYILISIAVIYLIFGIVWYLIAGGEDAKKKGSSIITRGIIGLVIIFSIWGLVALVIRIVKIDQNTTDINTNIKNTQVQSALGPVPKVQ